ncbi:MAG: nickel pincer cofactor biosynthesis protein LarB [Candidatus Bathyarchaeota archaeon]|nr:nickel pincer cofactor biosynthesis protein LarB [Candidatus Bathyarchaeota archaeon]
MDSFRDVLEKVAKKELSPPEAEKMLRLLAIDELGSIAKIDGNRELRKGIPEIILAEGKTAPDVAEIALKTLEKRGRVIVSRCSPAHIRTLQDNAPTDAQLQICQKACMAILKKPGFTVKSTGGKVGILTAGTSDIPVAEEAKVIAQEMGCKVVLAYDVGVAGIHRLMQPLKTLVAEDVDVVVVVAGREGALASVVAGLVDVPVVAVPTSNSFGFGEKGVSALMAMLQSCSLGLAVVNIDGGVAAGATATLIANRAAKFKSPP